MLSEAIGALVRHDATCTVCEATLPDTECGERARLKASWRRAVREGARLIAGGTAAETAAPSPRCLDCGATYRFGDGYGDEQLFCSETCADSYRRELGA